MDWNKKIRTIRRGLEVSQSEAAKGLGISQSYLSKLELGKTEPDIELMEHIALYYGSDVLTIFFDKSDKLREDN